MEDGSVGRPGWPPERSQRSTTHVVLLLRRRGQDREPESNIDPIPGRQLAHIQVADPPRRTDYSAMSRGLSSRPGGRCRADRARENARRHWGRQLAGSPGRLRHLTMRYRLAPTTRRFYGPGTTAPDQRAFSMTTRHSRHSSDDM